MVVHYTVVGIYAILHSERKLKTCKKQTRCRMLRTLQSSPHPVFSRTVCASVATAWCSAAPSGRWSVELPITINGRVAEFKV